VRFLIDGVAAPVDKGFLIVLAYTWVERWVAVAVVGAFVVEDEFVEIVLSDERGHVQTAVTCSGRMR